MCSWLELAMYLHLPSEDGIKSAHIHTHKKHKHALATMIKQYTISELDYENTTSNL